MAPNHNDCHVIWDATIATKSKWIKFGETLIRKERPLESLVDEKIYSWSQIEQEQSDGKVKWCVHFDLPVSIEPCVVEYITNRFRKYPE